MKTLNTNIAKIRDKNNNWSSIPALKGESAYELAVKKGFEGSEDDFNNSLVKKEEIDKINKNINLLLNKSIKNEIIENASGSNIIIEDSSEQESLKECKIYGWSKQFTTTGKNLINADEYYSQFKQSDGTYKLKTVILNDIRISLSEFVGKEITLSVKLTVGANTSAVFLMYVSSEQKKINGSTIKSGLTGKSILTVTPVSNTDYFVISFGSGNDDVTFSELQLELGSVATSYEPYTGGNPSPSPEYPQQIESAGSDGKINLEVHGKNLFDLEYASHLNNWMQGVYRYIPYYVGKGNKVSVSYSEKLPIGREFYAAIGQNKGNVQQVYAWLYYTAADIGKTQFTFTAGEDYIYLNMTGNNIQQSIKELKNLQIEVSPSPTAYEPYHEPQSFSIQTPTGLPAIPVGKGGNYTDTNGQQWIADYIDIKRGKYVQWIGKCNLENLSWRLNGNVFHSSEINNSKKYEWTTEIANLICSHYVCNMTAYNMNFNSDGLDNLIGMYSKGVVIKDTKFNNDVELFKKSLNGVYVYYVLDEPIERDLTPEEIQAYKNLVTYAGTTIVENDADCYMKLGYVADPKAYIDKKFSELSSAIIASSSEAE